MYCIVKTVVQLVLILNQGLMQLVLPRTAINWLPAEGKTFALEFSINPDFKPDKHSANSLMGKLYLAMFHLLACNCKENVNEKAMYGMNDKKLSQFI